MAQNIFETTQPRNIFDQAPRNVFDTDLNYMSIPYDEAEDPYAFSVLTESDRIEFEDMGKIGWFEAYERQEKGDLIPFSPTGVIRSGSMLGTVLALQENNYKDESQKLADEHKFIDFVRKMEEERIRGFTKGARIYQGASNLPGFMVEFWATGGLASAGKATAKKAATEGIEAISKGVVRKILKKGVGIAGAAAYRAPVMYNHYVPKFAEKQIFANIAITDKGVGILREGTEAVATSAVKAYADTFIEVYSETLGGEVFRPVAGLVGNKLSESLSPAMRAGIVKFMNTITAKGKITDVMTKTGFNGIIEEMGEEVVGDQLRAAFNVESFGVEDGPEVFNMDRMEAAVPGWDDLLVMAGIFAIPGATSYTSQKLYNKLRDRGATEQQIRSVDQDTSETEKESILDDILAEESEAVQTAIKSALGGKPLDEFEQYSLKEKFDEYVDKGWINLGIKDQEEGVSVQNQAKAVQTINKSLEDKITATITTPEGVTPAKQTRAQKFQAIKDRVTEIKKRKVELGEQKGVIKEALDFTGSERKKFRNRVKRYKDDFLKEEYDALPVYFRGKKGSTLDEIAQELGLESDMEARDYLIDLDRHYKQSKADIADINEQIREETQRKEVQSELASLKRRLSDFQAGKFEGVKERDAFRKEVTAAARKILPQGKRRIGQVITAINAATTPAKAREAIQKITEVYEEYLDRLVRAKAAKKILKRYKRPENVLDVKYQEQISKELAKFGETKADAMKELRKLSTDQLVGLARKVAELTEKGKLSLERKKELRIMASEIMRAATIKAAGGEIAPLPIGSVEQRKKVKKGISRFNLEFIRPVRLVRELFGKFGEKMFYDSVEHAETLAQASKIERIQKMEVIAKKHKMNRNDLGSTVTIDGVTFQINNILTFYAQRNNPEAKAALIHGNEIKPGLFDKFVDWLSKNRPQYMKAVDEIKEVVGDRFAESSRVMEEAYNVKVEKVADYFPMNRRRLETEADPDSLMAMDIIGDAVMKKGHGIDFASVERGFNISREQIAERNQKPLDLDFMGVALRAIDNQEHFIHYAPIQKMYNNLKADEAVRDAIILNHGEAAWNTFDRYMNEVINPRTAYVGLDFISQRIRETRRALGTLFLGFNVITAMKQYPSAHLALKYTTLGQLYKSMTASIFRLKKLEDLVFPFAPALKNRIVERDIGEIMQGVTNLSTIEILRQLQIAENQIGKVAFGMILNMDRRAVLAVYDAVYQHQRKTVSEKEARDLAAKAIIETQPQGRRIDLPQAHRTNNEWYRMVLMFTNQLNQIYNMMIFDAPAEWKRKERGKAMVGLASIMASSAMIYMASHGGAWPDDEEEQGWAFFDAIMGSFISSIPILGNLVMSQVRGYSPSVSPLDSVIQGFKFTAAKFKSGNTFEAMLDVMINVAALSGVRIPATQFNRLRKGILDLTSGKSDDPRRLIYSKSALFE